MAKASDGKAGEGGGAPFARDLGYLDRFFDALEAHAGTLADGPGARLRTLIGEERTRWQEIRGLIGAGPMTAPASPSAKPPARQLAKTAPVVGRPARSANPDSPDLAPPPRVGSRFTVGPLRGRGRGR